MIYFEMVGKLKLLNDTENFKSYQENTYESGWTSKTLMFLAVCGDNQHMLKMQGGYYSNDDYKIRTMSVPLKDDADGKGKSESIEIPWKDRLKSQYVNKVAEYRKTIIDIDDKDRRKLLEKCAEKLKEGTSLTDEELKKVGLNNESEVAEALAKSKKKCCEFISMWDAIDFMRKVLSSDAYKDKKFRITGYYDCQYSDMKNDWYINLIPQKIVLAPDEAEEHATGRAILYYTSNAVDDNDVETKHVYYVNAYTMEYNNERKKNLACPFKLVIPDKLPDAKTGESNELDGRRAKRLASKFQADDGEVKMFGIKYMMVNGAEKIEITEDMLTDDQKEDLEIGLITLDDIRADLGGSVYGKRIQKNVYQSVMTGKKNDFTSGPKSTSFTVEDLTIPAIESDTDIDDLFDEDEDELFK